MSTTSAPACRACGHPLDRVDHVGIEHTILDGEGYRPVSPVDGPPGVGLASETQLRCGRCGAEVERADREFFYRRWWALKAVEAGEPPTCEGMAEGKALEADGPP